MRHSFRKKLPLWLNKDVLNTIASLREKKITENEKFFYLKNRDIHNLIKPSIEVRHEKKSDRTYRKKINAKLLAMAITVLDRGNFVDDILEFAKTNGLLEIKYEVWFGDFLAYKASPVINAWDARLKFLSLLWWQSEIKNKGGSLIDAYLPPKFEKKVLDIMDNYSLEFYWYESIVHLLITGTWYLPKNAFVIHLELHEENIDEKKGFKPNIFLGISSITTQADIRYRWKKIELLKREIFPAIKQKNKLKDIVEAFHYEFTDELPKAAENGKIDRYLKYTRKLKKQISRTRKDYDEFISSYKSLPPDIHKQIDTLDQWHFERFDFF